MGLLSSGKKVQMGGEDFWTLLHKLFLLFTKRSCVCVYIYNDVYTHTENLHFGKRKDHSPSPIQHTAWYDKASVASSPFWL